MRYFTIMIQGQRAVDAGRAYCGGKCYRKICGGLAQLEVVLDEDTLYNGIPQKWVSVAYIKNGRDIPRVLDALRGAGFAGCPCIVSEDVETGSYAKQTELCSFRV